MIRIHREGTGTINIAAIIAGVLVVVSSYVLHLSVFIVILILFATTMVLVFRFFRVPKRNFLTDESIVVAPADGKIVAIEKVEENEYFKEPRTLVSIFMSIYNVHMNWFPIAGTITYFKYHPGKYFVARYPKSSELNERTTVVIKNNQQEILVRQIAGFIARRIICYANPGRNVLQSEEMGFIKFGSRLDIYLPSDAKILVKLQDKTTGGVTRLARFK
ncbi:MAG: phosphatidylserine decarboxylase family protein [Bacteroidales bacterium]